MRMARSQKAHNSANGNPKAPNARLPPSTRGSCVILFRCGINILRVMIVYTNLSLLNDFRAPKPQAQGGRGAILNDAAVLSDDSSP